MKVKRLGMAVALASAVMGLASCGTKTNNSRVIAEPVISGDSGTTTTGDNSTTTKPSDSTTTTDNSTTTKPSDSTTTTKDNNTTTQQGNTSNSSNNNSELEKLESSVVATKMTVSSYGGDQESAYVEFNPVSGASNYKVLVKKVKDSNLNAVSSDYKAIDEQLIRKYKDGSSYKFRADALGLSAGVYDIKVTYVLNNETVEGAVISNIGVVSYDRSGFAFSKNSYNSTGDASGAYKEDGTLKDNARVLYVSASNAKTVQLTVNNGTETTLTGLQAIIDGYQKGKESRPLAIRILGEITASDMDALLSSGEGLQVKGKGEGNIFNMTIEGVGNDAFIHGFGFLVKNVTNLEIRNLGVATLIDDDISLDGGNYNVWVHDNDLFYGKNGSGDHAKGDGSLDIKGTFYATLSYNHYYDSGKSTLHSNTKSGSPDVDYVSYHHNWFDHSDSRHPRIRLSTAVHIYNNYYDGNAKYGVGVTTGSSAFVENNYFRNCKDPMLSSLQGTDAKGDGTFSSESGGMIKAFGNTIIWEGAMAGYSDNLVYANAAQGNNAANATSFDAYLASTRNEVVPNTYKTVSGGSTYSNFDTNSSIMYSYSVQTPEEAMNTTKNYAGRIQGGDIKWTFDNATEDLNYDVIPGLRSYLDSYKNNNILEIMGLGTQASESSSSSEGDSTSGASESSETGETPNTGSAITGSIVATFPYTGSDFTIVGRTSTGKGSVTYNNTTYSECLKMETSTSVTFTTSATMTLTLIINGTNIKIDGTKYTGTAEGDHYVITLELSAGTHTITKADTANIFYISLA